MLNKFMGPLMAIYVFSKPFLKSLQQVGCCDSRSHSRC